MGAKGSKNISSGGKKEETNKEQLAPPATAAESTEPKTSSEAGNEAGGQISPTTATADKQERTEGQAQELCESAAEDMDKEYVEAVVAKASEFGENE